MLLLKVWRVTHTARAWPLLKHPLEQQMYSAEISPPSSDVGDESASEEEQRPVLSQSIAFPHCIWIQYISFSVLLRLHQNVITLTLFTWEPWTQEGSFQMIEMLFPLSLEFCLVSSVIINPGSIGKQCAFLLCSRTPYLLHMGVHGYLFYSLGFCGLNILLPTVSLFSLPRGLVNTHVFSANKIQFRESFILKY